jgi:hypothetical protein
LTTITEIEIYLYYRLYMDFIELKSHLISVQLIKQCTVATQVLLLIVQRSAYKEMKHMYRSGQSKREETILKKRHNRGIIRQRQIIQTIL